VSMQEMADAFKAKPDATAQATSDRAEATQPASPTHNTAQADPMQWWGALTEQFQTIATGAMRDMNEQAASMMAAAQSADAGAKKAAVKKPAAKKPSSPAAAKPKAPAKAPAKKAVKSAQSSKPTAAKR